jgi:hypothetical protein
VKDTESNDTVSAHVVPNDELRDTTNQTSESTASVKEPFNNTASSKSSGSGWRSQLFRKKSHQETSVNATEEPAVASSETAAAGASVTTSNSTTDEPSANVTGSPEQQEPKPASLPQQHSIVTLGPPTVARPIVVPNHSFPQRRTMPASSSRDNHPPAKNPVVIPDVVGSIASTALRLMFLTWVTKRMATQEESIQPSQHYCWERLNDRFSRDTTALQTALNQPPQGVATSFAPSKWSQSAAEYRQGFGHNVYSNSDCGRVEHG